MTPTSGENLLLKRGSVPFPQFEFNHRTAIHSGISVVGQQDRRLDCADDLFGKEEVVPMDEGTECESFCDSLLYF